MKINMSGLNTGSLYQGSYYGWFIKSFLPLGYIISLEYEEESGDTGGILNQGLVCSCHLQKCLILVPDDTDFLKDIEENSRNIW